MKESEAETRQRLLNLLLFKMPLTNREMEENAPRLVVVLVMVLVVAGIVIWRVHRRLSRRSA